MSKECGVRVNVGKYEQPFGRCDDGHCFRCQVWFWWGGCDSEGVYDVVLSENQSIGIDEG